MPKSKRILFYGAITLIAVFFWNSGVLYPVRMLAVFFHELSHLIVALITGGKVREFILVPGEGGHVLTEGGNLPLIALSGYTGSLLSGLAVLLVSDRTSLDRWVSGILGAIVIFVGFAFGDSLFTALFCLITGAVLMGIALFLPPEINDLILRFVGLSVMLYAPYDVLTDVFLSNGYVSDAGLLSESLGGSAKFWGWVWLLTSGITIAGAFIYLLGKPLPGEEERQEQSSGCCG